VFHKFILEDFSWSGYFSWSGSTKSLDPAHSMVNAGWLGEPLYIVYILVLSHLQADFLQTFHNCYCHIDDVHVTLWKCL
jgi:hypothetical protein